METIENYTYDDPRLLYDESYFFYNGGFDLIFLYGSYKKTGGRSGMKTTQKSYPQPEMTNLLFKSCVEFVNNENYNEKCEIKKYTFNKNLNFNIFVKDLKIKKSKTILTSKLFSPEKINKYMKIDDSFIETTISSSVTQTKLKTYVSSSLKLNCPKKIKLNSTIFKKR